ncbi:polyprenyl synthetase family protein [Ornithinicoccus halotolerans]|uniref:polyprenyl synthetase family protein n=1 Tax=Ornithinicoccus halotolerans TaxID=1748220 RepID=UPI001E4B7A58|nr:polyprenyl synthetase family protein [Ornithinicoccus halotolerans]
MTRADPLDLLGLRARVQAELDAVVAAQREVLADLGEPMAPLVDAVAALLAGGKRLRAAFLYWGYRAQGGPDSAALVRAASAMELFQAAALLHDDVMDDSDLRRGSATAHRRFAAQHADAGWEGDAERFGRSAAILAGDLCLNWSDETFAGSGLPATELQRARPVFDRMRTQLMGGQYLDVLLSQQDWDALDHTARVEQCRTVIRFKSAQYSIEQPLLIGATAAGAGPEDVSALSRYGLALGEAFQLRDDVLGVFGDPGTTGKPAGDDLREGKRTVLVAHALEHASREDAALLRTALGDPGLTPQRVEECRAALERSGAVELTETMIRVNSQQAASALADASGVTEEGREALTALIEVSTARAT